MPDSREERYRQEGRGATGLLLLTSRGFSNRMLSRVHRALAAGVIEKYVTRMSQREQSLEGLRGFKQNWKQSRGGWSFRQRDWLQPGSRVGPAPWKSSDDE